MTEVNPGFNRNPIFASLLRLHGATCYFIRDLLNIRYIEQFADVLFALNNFLLAGRIVYDKIRDSRWIHLADMDHLHSLNEV
jgi:hypothetical protein